MWGHALHANLKAVVAPAVILIQVQRYHVLCEKQKNLHIVNSFEEFLDSLLVDVGILGEGIGVDRSVSHPHFLITIGLGFGGAF